MAACPELADATFAILAAGWHSPAVEVGGRGVFKFPRGAEAAAALLREAAVLRLVRPAVSLPVPAPQVFAGPPLFSRHEKLPGGYLLGEDYRRLDEPARQAVGDALGRFYAELHRLPPARMRAVGALPVRPWESPAAMRRRALPLLPAAWRERAERLVREYAKLPADPLGSIFGFFDGHGWNMAFDSEAGRLNGVYDFADAGIGPLHQEFIYSAFIDADLTERIVAAYERFSGRRLERRRIALLTAAHRLSELAELADEPRHLPEMLAGALDGLALAEAQGLA
ncbi:aminoglycoside phosphotransferase family protein [Pseudomonas aeruginosa]|nr:aminoglycoside phosphotransferase family protein [Pseudomonas aeruginosa]